MPETNFTKEDFARYQEFFRTLPPEEHLGVVQDLIGQLYQFIHAFIKYMDKPDNIGRTTSLANSYTFRLLQDYEKKIVEPFQGADAFPQYLRYLQQGITWFVNNKIKKVNDFPFIQPPIDSETEQEIDIPDNYEPDPFTQEIIEQLINILDKELDDDQKQLIEMRLGLKFEIQGKSARLIQYQEPMTFPEIAAELNLSTDAVRMRFVRLIDAIKETPAVILLYRDL